MYVIFLYAIEPNQYHTILLYNRGIEPQTTLGGHPGWPSGLSGGLSGGPVAYTNEAARWPKIAIS
jgi:hypothetical protein